MKNDLSDNYRKLLTTIGEMQVAPPTEEDIHCVVEDLIILAQSIRYVLQQGVK